MKRGVTINKGGMVDKNRARIAPNVVSKPRRNHTQELEFKPAKTQE